MSEMVAVFFTTFLIHGGAGPEPVPVLPMAETPAVVDHQPEIARLTDLIEPAETPPGLRGAMLLQRASLWLASEQVAKAIDDCNAAIELDPANPGAYQLRAAAFQVQGNWEAAEADRSLANDLYWSNEDLYWSDEPYLPQGDRWWLFLVLPWHSESWLILVELWVVVSAVYLAIARRQRIHGGGTIRRWLGVSLATAALAVAPYGVWTFADGLLLHKEAGHVYALAATIISAFIVAFSLGPPVRLLHSKRQLHLVDDEAFLARVGELAEKMGIAVPRVRLLRSTSEMMQALAFAGGLPAPSLVVSDGVLHRLAPAERDGVVAHEMAHVANGSLWFFAVLGPISCVAALMAAGMSPTWILFGFGVFVGLRRIVNRFLEADCDRRAADAIGYREMVSALVKIHTAHPIPDKGILSALIYATATHPPREVRLAALARRAPPEDRPEVAVSIGRIRWHRILSFAAAVVWLGALATAVVPHWYPDWAVWASVPLIVVVFTPVVLFALGLRRLARRAKRRMGKHTPSGGTLQTIVTIVVAVMVYLAVQVVIPTDEALGHLISLLVVVGVVFVVFVLWPGKTARLRKKVAVALQLHDFDHVVELEQRAPKTFARDPVLRYNFAVAAGLSGDRDRAIAELEGLRQDQPKFKLAWLVLGAFYLEVGRPDPALELAEEVTDDLKDDPAPHGLAAQALWRLGRVEEAQASMDRALAIEPDAGDGLAIAARIALDRNDVARAKELIEKAEEHAPGDANVLIARAEMALATETLEAARAAVQKALEAAEANPFALLSFETSALRGQLAQRETHQTDVSDSRL
ncbi:MAG: tetratricopeptide repeat protein [Planctomycetota bacterium]|jgi:Zn-dependent protease with chaperone function/Tfp pilus assembly protein PilF